MARQQRRSTLSGEQAVEAYAAAQAATAPVQSIGGESPDEKLRRRKAASSGNGTGAAVKTAAPSTQPVDKPHREEPLAGLLSREAYLQLPSADQATLDRLTEMVQVMVPGTSTADAREILWAMARQTNPDAATEERPTATLNSTRKRISY